MLKLIRKMDRFGQPIQLNINKSSTHKTIFGSILTLFLVIFSIIQLINFISEMLSRNKPTVIYNDHIIQNDKRILIESMHLPFAIQVLRNNTIVKPDQKYFTIIAKLVKLTKNYNNSEINYMENYLATYKIEPCELKTHFYNDEDFGQYKQFIEQNQLLCLQNFLDQEQGPYLSQNTQTFENTYLEIEFKYCQGKNKQGLAITCLNKTEIDNELNLYRFELFYFDMIMLPNNFQRPFQKIMKSISIVYYDNQLQEVNLYYQNQQVQSDQGLIFTDKIYDQYQMVSSIQRTSQSADKLNVLGKQEDNTIDKSNFIKWNIILDMKERIIERQYLKLYVALAQLGGLIKTLSLIFSFIVKPVAQLSMRLHISQKLFDFEQESTKNINLLQSSQMRDKQLSIRSFNNLQQVYTINVNNNVDHLRQSNIINSVQPVISQVNISQNEQGGPFSQSIANNDSPLYKSKRFIRINKKTSTKVISNIFTQFIHKDQQDNQDKCNSNEAPVNSNMIQLDNQSQIQQQKPRTSFCETNGIANKSKLKTNVKTIENMINKILKGKKQILMSIMDYIKYYFQCFKMCYSYKKYQINFTHQRISERLDLIFILKKLLEIDKMKLLFLDKDQIKLFDYLPKPLVKQTFINQMQKYQVSEEIINDRQTPKNDEQWNLLSVQKSEIQKVSEACKSFIEILNKQQHSNLDIKLIEQLDNRIKEYFLKVIEYDKIHTENQLNDQLPIQEFNQSTNRKIFYNQQIAEACEISVQDDQEEKNKVKLQDFNSNHLRNVYQQDNNQ